MGYVNDNDPNVSYSSLPGDSVPIDPNLPPGYVMAGLGHTPAIPGSLTSPPYSYYGNSTTMAGQMGNGFPIQGTGFAFPPLPNSLYFNTLIGGGGGGGGGVDHRTVVTVPSGGTYDFLTVSSSETTVGSTTTATYTLDYDGIQTGDKFSQAVNACVSTGSFVAFKNVTGNTGTVVASSSTDDLFLKGDWTSAVNDGSQYLKAVAQNLSSEDTVTFSFERFLPEKITADSGGILESGKKGGILKIEGGDGITTKVQAADLSSEGSNKDLKVVIDADNTSLDQIELVVITAVGTSQTFTETGGGNSITSNVYSVAQVDIQSSSTYTSGATGSLYDFSRNKNNEPAQGAGATFTFQTLEVGTVLPAKKVVLSPTNTIWVTGGVPTLNFSC